MTDVLANGITWLAGVLKASAGRAVTYIRGAASVALTATVGQTVAQLMSEEGAVTEEVKSRDYIFTAADLILSGAVTLPVAGDRITEVSGGVTYTQEVMPFNSHTRFGDEPCYRFADPYRTILRVHTKYVA